MLTRSLTRRALLAGITILFLPAAVPSAAQQEALGRQRRLNINDLDWLAGAWKGTLPDGEVDQTWTPPSGRTILGTNRVINNRRAVLRQFFLIEQAGDRITLSIHTVGEGGGDVPDGDVYLRLVSLRGSEAVFETPGRLTKRVTYRVDPDGYLSGRVETFRTPGGTPERVQVRLQRVRDL